MPKSKFDREAYVEDLYLKLAMLHQLRRDVNKSHPNAARSIYNITRRCVDTRCEIRELER